MTDVNVWISGKQSRLARLALDKSLKDIADEAGLGVNTISRFEQTNYIGAAKTVRKLVETYSRLGIEFPDARTVRFPPEDVAA